MSKQHTERAFEEAIEYDMTHGGGYSIVDKDCFDQERAIFPAEVMAFIKQTQPDEWAYLENIRISRGRGGSISRTLSRKEMEERLEQILRQRGEAFLNTIRDEARELADKLDAEKEYKQLDELIVTAVNLKHMKPSW